MASLDSRIIEGWNYFFFARTKNSSRAMIFMGYLRIFYGCLMLYDRLLLGMDFHLFFISKMIPCQQFFRPMADVAAEDQVNRHIDPTYPSSPMCAIATYLPASFYPALAWSFYYIGLIHMLLLIVGVAPKLQLLGIHFNLVSLHFYSPLPWDGEDVMLKIWNFLFLFLPLHHVTIYEFLLKSRSTKTTDCPLPAESWPMWPFRLFQLEVCFIYLGAGFGKLASPHWRSGNALYRIIHQREFFGGPFVPEFLFGRYGPLKIMTWVSLFLECTGLFLVWWPSRAIRYGVVATMIILHVGIDLAMNMHIFEWLSIIGWCMFLFESSERQPSSLVMELPAPKEEAFLDRRWVINLLLISVILTFFVDTFPIIYIYESLVCLLHPMTGLSVSSPALRDISKWVSRVHTFRKKVIIKPFVSRYLDPLGLYQDEWDMYEQASDEFWRFETILSIYMIHLVSSGNITNDAETMEDVHVLSPDWGIMTWYEKKRWQRHMTMYDNFQTRMCFDCFVQYQAQQYLQEQFRVGIDSASEDVGIASIRLVKHTEKPPPPPELDDWWNWTGWFYADAKQTVFERETETLFVLNLCDDLSSQCTQWKRDGLCDIVSNHHVDRYTYNRSVTDQDRFTMTQLCRRSCQWCPEDGYDADTLLNGTRISVIWPIPSKLYMYSTSSVEADDAAMYYDATIVEVVDHPMKRYLLTYDDRRYESEWFDPIILRERGYRLFSITTDLDLEENDEIDNLPVEVDLSEPSVAKLLDEL